MNRFNLFGWFSKLNFISILKIKKNLNSYCDQKDNRRKFARRTMTSNSLISRDQSKKIQVLTDQKQAAAEARSR